MLPHGLNDINADETHYENAAQVIAGLCANATGRRLIAGRDRLGSVIIPGKSGGVARQLISVRGTRHAVNGFAPPRSTTIKLGMVISASGIDAATR